MKLLFLGTGAADRMNAVQDNDFNDPDARRCTSTLVDGQLLIDAGPHVLSALKIAKIDPAAITDVVCTHLHADHFRSETVEAIAQAGDRQLRVWMRGDEELPKMKNCRRYAMTLGKASTVGDFRVTPLPGNHPALTEHLLLEKDGRSLFYALDGAWMMSQTVGALKSRRLDALVLDATCGDYVGDCRLGEHNSLPMIRLMLPSLKTLSIIDDHTKIILDHIAVCLHKGHEDLCRRTKEDGLIPARDGMTMEI